MLLAANLDHMLVEPPTGMSTGFDETAGARDVLDALNFAAAVHAKNRPSADSIWNRLVTEQRPVDLTIAMLHLHKKLRAQGEHPDKPRRPHWGHENDRRPR